MTAPRVAIAYDCVFPVNTGGGERVYRRMAELLVDRGAQVTYVTRAQWAPDAAPAVPFDLVSVWRGPIYDDRGVRTSRSAVAFALGLFRHFARARGRYDLVVVAALPVLNVFAVRLALWGSPAVVAVDWLEVWPARKWRAYAGVLTGTVAATLQWLAVRVGRIQTVNSGFTGRRLRRSRPGADPIVLGLLDLAGPPRETPRDVAPGGDPYVLFVGRHIADKRLHVLPPALAAARRSAPTLRARVVGTGPETDRARRAAIEHDVADAIDFLGRVDDDELDALVAGAAALVNPSEREGFGLVVAEAAAFGTPAVVVAGEDNAAAELVVTGVNGVLAGDASPDVLGAAIVEAVAGGDALRHSTAAWFARERTHRSLSVSVGELLRRAAATRR
ncbi:glycosyltransferase family 4 protein [Agromyces sp. SYSU T0242]|uniref:glycosyltransferase family 4 protein n=1 Tax=Agromyces litoreus TaxID=3158561 RepID=UPI003394B896